MKEVHMNDGEYIPYTHTKKSITFDEDLSCNLLKREEDEDVVIDIYYDMNKDLMLGYNVESQHMVAQVLVPARKYTFDEKENPDYDPEKEDGPQNQKTITEKNPVPFNIENCTVYLYSI